MKRSSVALIALLAMVALPAAAQTALVAPSASTATPAAAPTPNPSSSAANKPDEASMKAAADFVDVTQSTTIVDRLLPMIEKNYSTRLLRENPGKQDAIALLMQKSFGPSFTSHIEGFKRHLAFIYASHLTRAQLEELSTFYRTPTGAAYLKAMPGIMEETMATAKVWMTENVRDATSKLVIELKKQNLNVPKEMEGK